MTFSLSQNKKQNEQIVQPTLQLVEEIKFQKRIDGFQTVQRQTKQKEKWMLIPPGARTGHHPENRGSDKEKEQIRGGWHDF